MKYMSRNFLPFVSQRLLQEFAGWLICILIIFFIVACNASINARCAHCCSVRPLSAGFDDLTPFNEKHVWLDADSGGETLICTRRLPINDLPYELPPVISVRATEVKLFPEFQNGLKQIVLYGEGYIIILNALDQMVDHAKVQLVEQHDARPAGAIGVVLQNERSFYVVPRVTSA